MHTRRFRNFKSCVDECLPRRVEGLHAEQLQCRPTRIPRKTALFSRGRMTPSTIYLLGCDPRVSTHVEVSCTTEWHSPCQYEYPFVGRLKFLPALCPSISRPSTDLQRRICLVLEQLTTYHHHCLQRLPLRFSNSNSNSGIGRSNSSSNTIVVSPADW